MIPDKVIELFDSRFILSLSQLIFGRKLKKLINDVKIMSVVA